MTFLNIYFFIKFTKIDLIPSFIVYAIGFYMRLCNSSGFNFTRAYITLINFKVGAKRITDFLLIKELQENRIEKDKSSRCAVQIERLNYSWSKVGILKVIS
jgi:hypothetical protein